METKKISRHWLVFTGACLMVLTMSCQTFALSYITGSVLEEFGFTRAAFILYYSISDGIAMISLPLTGRYLDKVGVKKMLIFACTFYVLGFVVFTMSNSLPVFYVAGVLMGIGKPVWMTVSVVLINRWFIRNKGTFMGITTAFSGVGGAIFGAIIPTFIGMYGWRSSIVLLIAVTVALSVIAFVLIKDSPESTGLKPYGYVENLATSIQGGGSPDVPGVPYGKAVKSPQFIFLFITLILLSVSAGMLQHIPIYFTGVGLSSIQAGSLMSIYSIAAIFTKILTGIMDDKLGTIRSMIIIYTIFFMGYAAISNVSSYPLYLICILCFAFGIGTQAVFPPLLIGKVFGQKDYNKIYSTIGMTGYLGSSIGVPAWGLVYDMFGAYDNAFYIACVLIVIVTMAFILIMRSAKGLMAKYGLAEPAQMANILIQE